MNGWQSASYKAGSNAKQANKQIGIYWLTLGFNAGNPQSTIIIIEKSSPVLLVESFRLRTTCSEQTHPAVCKDNVQPEHVSRTAHPRTWPADQLSGDIVKETGRQEITNLSHGAAFHRQQSGGYRVRQSSEVRGTSESRSRKSRVNPRHCLL